MTLSHRLLTVLLTALLCAANLTLAQSEAPVTPGIKEAGGGGSGGYSGGGAALEKLDFRAVVQDAKAKVFPAVVYIKCVRENMEGGKKETQEVAGSGVIISADGLMLTNWHVVEKAIEVRCLLSSGQPVEAKVLGSDKDVDLALVQLKLSAEVKTFPFAALGDSQQLKEGDFVMAMGAPWGLNRSVSIGIISCTNRFLPEQGEYSLWLQTDASISPGNSGGPLVNTQGQVIGINTLGGGGLGFSVPSATIRDILPQLKEHGQVNWSWTGLELQPLRDFNKNIYFDAREGVLVAETDPDSPARKAGIKARDRILKINDQPIQGITEEDLPAIRRKLGLLPKDKPVKVELVREGQIVNVEFIPRAKGKVEGEEQDCPRWNLTVKAVNQFDNPDLYFQRKQGVFIFGIRSPGNAQNAGLNQKDIVLKIEDREILTLADVKSVYQEALDNLAKKPKIRISVLRNGLMRQMVLDFSRDYEKE